MEDYPGVAERGEDLEPVPEELAPETPEADALEQAAPVDPTPEDDRADPVGDARRPTRWSRGARSTTTKASTTVGSRVARGAPPRGGRARTRRSPAVRLVGTHVRGGVVAARRADVTLDRRAAFG
jgi:hypothetical protein